MSRKSSPRSLYPSNLNVAILGANGAGKSALVVKYLTRRFISEYAPYLEDTYQKTEHVDNNEILLNIMDTYDRETLDTVRCMKWADLIVVIYSITSRSHYYRARELIEAMTQSEVARDPTIILVANKLDLERYRLVTKEEGEKLAAEFRTLFFEVTVTEEYKVIECIFHVAIRRHVRYRRTTNSANGLLSPGNTASLDRNIARQRSPKLSAVEAGSRADRGAGGHGALGHTLSLGSTSGPANAAAFSAAAHSGASAKKNSAPFRFFRNIIK